MEEKNELSFSEAPLGTQENCVPEETATVTENGKKSILDKIPAKKLKSALIIAIAVILVVVAAIVAHNNLSPRAIAKRYTVAVVQNDAKTQTALTAYNLKSSIMDGYDSEEDFFVDLSDIYDENIQSWNDLFAVIKSTQRDDYEDDFGKNYKVKSEIKKERDYSTNNLEEAIQDEIESDFEYEDYEDYGLFKDSISAGKKIVVRVSVTGEYDYEWEEYSVYLVKTNGLWKVITGGVE